MLEDPEQIVGYEEQYAAAAAVIARTASLPVRVVVGYQIPADRVANGTARGRRRTTSRRGSRSTPASSAGCRSTSRRRRSPARPAERGHDRAAGRHPEPAAAPAAAAGDPAAAPGGPRRRQGRGLRPARPTRGRRAAPSTATWVAVGAGGGPARCSCCSSPRSSSAGRHCADSGAGATRRPPARVAGAWAEAADRAVEAGAPRLVRTTPHEAVRGYVDERPELRRPRARPAAARQPGRPGHVRRRAADDEHADVAWAASDRVAADLRGAAACRRGSRCASTPDRCGGTR